MALPQSALSELLEAFRAGDGVDLVRDSVRVALQELIEPEATERIGSAPYERSEDRTAERNGHRQRMLTTKAGDVELRIPRLRKGSFFPIILEPRRRIDQALYAVVMEAYVHGISTRAVDDLAPFRECFTMCEAAGDLWWRGAVHFRHGLVAWIHGQFEVMSKAAIEALRASRLVPDLLTCVDALCLAGVAQVGIDDHRAAYLFGAAEATGQHFCPPASP